MARTTLNPYRAALNRAMQRLAADPTERIHQRHQRSIAAICRHLGDAVGGMRILHQALLAEAEHIPPGHRDEKVRLQLNRAYDHLTAAVADLPKEAWVAMLSMATEARETP